MAFRKKGYQEIVDDVLTGLTGGIVDEEHTYTGGTDTYDLESRARASGIVAVRGTLNGAAYTFAGSDYEADKNAAGEWVGLRWVGTTPDDGTAFFVNYYPVDAESPITDRNIGSVARTLVEALGREMATLYAQLDKVYLSAFVDTAEGRSLEFVVSILGLERILAGRAVGEVEFGRSTPAAGDITIPLGTLVSDRDDNRYETIERATLRQGQLSVQIPVRAVSEEEETVGPRTLTLMPRPVVGIESVVNYEATERGTRDETDEELRARAKVALYGAGKATVDAIRFAVLGQGVNSVVVRDMPLGVPGEVDVVVDYSGDLDKKRADIRQAIDETRAAGIRVNINPTDRVKLTLDLDVTLAVELLPDEQATLRRTLQQQIADYVTSLPAGKPVSENKIIGLVMADPRVQDVAFEVSRAGGVLPPGDVPMGQKEKAAVEDPDRDIEVTFQVAPAETAGEVPGAGEEVSGLTPIKMEVTVRLAALSDDLVAAAGSVAAGQERARGIVKAKVEAFLADLFAGDAIRLGDLLLLLASDKYTLASSGSMVRDVHVVDGLVVTMTEADDTDRVRETERIELDAVNVQFA